MSAGRGIRTTVCLIVLLAAGAGARTAIAADGKGEHAGDTLERHRRHVMMNHGLIMALQGSNLVMLSRMNLAPGLDEVTLKHGQGWFGQGKKFIEGAGPGGDPLVKDTLALHDAMQAVLKELEKMKPPGSSVEAVTMHHMCIALSHALERAVEGSNLILLGRMSRKEGGEEGSVVHGRSMMADARILWKEIVEGSAMKSIHGMGMSSKTAAMMGAIHRLADAGRKVMELEETMAGGK